MVASVTRSVSGGNLNPSESRHRMIRIDSASLSGDTPAYFFSDSFGKEIRIELGKVYSDPKAIEVAEEGEEVDSWENSCGSSEASGRVYQVIDTDGLELFAAVVEHENRFNAPEVTVSFHDDAGEAEAAVLNVVTPGWDGRC